MNKTTMFVLLLVASAVCLAVGVVIGYFARGQSGTASSLNDKAVDAYTAVPTINQRLMDLVDPEKIRTNLEMLSKDPHIAGTVEDEALATNIFDTWKALKLDSVKLVPYDVLLSYPNKDIPNKIALLSGTNQVMHETAHMETPLRKEDVHPKFAHAFHGYSPKGTVEGDLVYVNYARVEDFEELDSMNISVKGKLVIAKYGKIYRGNKVVNSQDRGALGVILFSDPSEVALMGTAPENVYPNSFWLPETGMQRGSVFTSNGDPLTPGFPSTEGAYRFPQNESSVPKIPSQPIGYGDAYAILRSMSGQDAPSTWQGGLNITYKIGPAFTETGMKIRLTVNNEYQTKRISNVIGIIKGNIEPDRYVLMGNHRDAWGFGAVDPSSGTAQLLEVVRVYSKLVEEGWRPRRTLVFCSWGAEEYGLIGSTEWVEQYVHKIMDRAVAYVNTDTCVSGDIFQVAASPTLREVVLHTTKLVPAPEDPARTLYDVKLEYQRNLTKKDDADLVIETVGSGSDMAPFAFFAGVPSIDLTWTVNRIKYNISGYPAYHTGYETFYLVDKILDPGFKKHQACGRITGIMLRYLADTLVLPLNAVDFAMKMQDAFMAFQNVSGAKFQQQGILLDGLGKAILNFQKAAEEWHQALKSIDRTNPIEVRMINDQITKFERVFILPKGVPGNWFYRHAVFAPSRFDAYSSKGFPALSDLQNGLDKDPNPELRWEVIKRHLSDLVIMVNQAASFLEPLHLI